LQAEATEYPPRVATMLGGLVSAPH
jgi:hypothetical protein